MKLILVILFVISFSFLSLAYGHATIVNTTPANGENLESPPNLIIITYSEGIQLGEFFVLDSDSNKIDIEKINIDDKKITISISKTPNGVYTVGWKVLSVDGHTTNGNFFFTVGEGVLSREIFLSSFEQQHKDYEFPYDEVILRWTSLSSFIFLVGLPITSIIVIPNLIRKKIFNEKKKFIKTVILLSAAILIIASTLLTIKQITGIHSVITAEVFQNFIMNTTLGKIWLIKMIFLLGLVGFVLSNNRWKFWLGLAVIVGIIVQITTTMSGHSASLIEGSLPILVDFSHLLASSLWAGGLFMLGFLFFPISQKNNQDSQIVKTTVKKFSIIAIITVSLLGITGLIFALWHISNVDAVFLTTYGNALLIKLSIFVAVIIIGAINGFYLSNKTGKWPAHKIVFTHSILIKSEFALVLSIFLISGILTSIQTASDEYTHIQSGTQLISQNTDDLQFDLKILPNKVGQNLLDVYVTKFGEPVSGIDNTKILLTLPDKGVQLPQFDLNEIELGLYSTFATFTQDGNWDIRFSGFVDEKYTTQHFTLKVISEHEKHDDTVSNRSTSFEELIFWIIILIVIVATVLILYEAKSRFWIKKEKKWHSLA